MEERREMSVCMNVKLYIVIYINCMYNVKLFIILHFYTHAERDREAEDR